MMILAQGFIETLSIALFVAGFLAAFGLVVYAILKFNRWYRRRAEASLERIYRDVGVPTDPSKGDVTVVFHTYHGFIAYFVQQEHNLRLPPEMAELLLKRLHGYNLRWGWLARGSVFIPILSYFNYRSQLGKVRRQARHSAKPVIDELA